MATFATNPAGSALTGAEIVPIVQGGVDKRTTAQDIADLAAASGAAIGEVNVFTKNQSVDPVALTDGANIAVDASASNNFTVTLGGNRTLDDPTNLTAGMVLNFQITQDGTGSRTLAFGSAYLWPGGTPPTLSTAAGAVDVISAISFDGTTLNCVAQMAFS